MAGRKITVNLPASVVKNRLRGDGVVEDYAEEILRLIEEDIQDAMENEKTSVITEIGTNFSVPNMSNMAAQRDIYYLVCNALIKADYSPRLLCNGVRSETQRVFILTKWRTPIDEEHEKYKDEFLSKITISVNTSKSRSKRK